ncbi:MAG: RNA-binding S4 domain-containing protein [Rhodospirillales bacterium]
MTPTPGDQDTARPPSARLDRWLWFARLFKSRARATAFCQAGRIRINGTPVAKAHHPIRAGDVLTFPLAAHVRIIRVLVLATRRGPAPEARLLYEDLTPSDSPPSGEGNSP